MNDSLEELRAKYRIICKKCGSENVMVDIEIGTDWGGDTGCDIDRMIFGCQDCKQNDHSFP